jgi:tetratricopeptide (TPR) repeat protein
MEVFSPWMLIRAWESLILGKRVIILSDDRALLSPCLEFLRELIKPMIYEGYFHHCCTNETKANHMQTTPLIGYVTSQYQRVMDIDNEIMIMNLDTKKIQFHLPTDKAKQTFLTAPPLLLERIHQRIIKIYQKKAECLNKFIINQSVSPFRSIIQQLLKFFVKLNSSLMCAQYCSNEDFYLSSPKCSLIPPELHQVASEITGPTASPEVLEIFEVTDRWKSDLFTDTGTGVVNGCLIDYQLKYWGDIQASKEWSKSSSSMEAKIMTLHEDYHPPYSVYCECDPFKLLVYEYADQLPVQSIIIASIDVVRPTQYPEYGFEIAIRSGKIFKFSTPNIRVRDVWIEFISRRVHECIYGHLPSYMHVKEMAKTPCKLSEQCCYDKEDKSKASLKGSFVEHGDWLIISDNNDWEKSKKIWYHYQEFRTEIFRTSRFAMFNLRTQGSAINLCDILDESSELFSKMKSSRVCKGNLANYSIFTMSSIRRNEEDEQDVVISDNDSDTTFTGDSESNRSKSEPAERPSFVILSDEADDFRLRAVYHNLSNLLSKQMYQDQLKALISMHQHDSSLVITLNLSKIINSSLSCRASSNSENGGNNNLQLLCEYVETVVPTLSPARTREAIQNHLLIELYNQEKTGIPRCILRTMLGIIYYQRKEYLEAIQYFAQDNLISPKIISECILNHFRNELQRNDRIFSEIHFINQMKIASPTFGIHSYLLLLEIILGNTTVTPYRSQNILAFKSTKSVANSVNDGILNDFIDTDRLREHPIRYTYNLIQVGTLILCYNILLFHF